MFDEAMYWRRKSNGLGLFWVSRAKCSTEEQDINYGTPDHLAVSVYLANMDLQFLVYVGVFALEGQHGLALHQGQGRRAPCGRCCGRSSLAKRGGLRPPRAVLLVSVGGGCLLGRHCTHDDGVSAPPDDNRRFRSWLC